MLEATLSQLSMGMPMVVFEFLTVHHHHKKNDHIKLYGLCTIYDASGLLLKVQL